MLGSTQRGLKTLPVVIGLLVLVALGSTSQARTITLRFAYTAKPTIAPAQGFQKFADIVNKETNGQVKVVLYDSGTLIKSDAEGIKDLQNGSLQMSGASVGNMAQFTRDFDFFDLPYLFSSLTAVPKVWHSKVGQQISSDLEKKLGVKVLMWMPNGGWQVLENTKRPVRVPSDLKGLTMRARPNPVEVALLSAWGAEGTSVSWPEVYTALSQGTVDGEILQYTWLYTSKQYEAVKYITEVNATPGPTFLGLISTRAWNSLTASEQNILQQAAAQAETYAYGQDAKQVAQDKAKIEQAGVKVYTPTAAQMALWKAKGQSIWAQFEKKEPQLSATVKQVQSIEQGNGN